MSILTYKLLVAPHDLRGNPASLFCQEPPPPAMLLLLLTLPALLSPFLFTRPGLGSPQVSEDPHTCHVIQASMPLLSAPASSEHAFCALHSEFLPSLQDSGQIFLF